MLGYDAVLVHQDNAWPWIRVAENTYYGKRLISLMNYLAIYAVKAFVMFKNNAKKTLIIFQILNNYF